MKLYVITNMPTSYRVDFFNLLTDKFGEDIKFVFINDPRFDYKNSISVFGNEPFIKRSLFYDSKYRNLWIFNFLHCLIKDRPSVIINGGMSGRAILLCIFAIFFKSKLFMWWGGTYPSNKDISMSKKFYRMVIASLAKGGIFYSQLAYNYYRSLTKKNFPYIIIGNNTRCSSSYHQQVVIQKSNPNNKAVRFLTVGFLTKNKNIIALLKAFLLVGNSKDISIELTVAGDGPERSILEEFCKTNKLANVTFLGHKSPFQMINVFANSDVYVHPSLRDQWPQTFNEAAAAGLPILISTHSGVWNKYTSQHKKTVLFDPNNIEKLADKIILLATDSNLRTILGKDALVDALEHDARYACNQVVKFTRW